MLEGKRKKRIREYLQGENYLGGLQQESYLYGQTRGTTKNIGEDLREIGEDKRENKLEIEEQWK